MALALFLAAQAYPPLETVSALYQRSTRQVSRSADGRKWSNGRKCAIARMCIISAVRVCKVCNAYTCVRVVSFRMSIRTAE